MSTRGLQEELDDFGAPRPGCQYQRRLPHFDRLVRKHAEIYRPMNANLMIGLGAIGYRGSADFVLAPWICLHLHDCIHNIVPADLRLALTSFRTARRIDPATSRLSG